MKKHLILAFAASALVAAQSPDPAPAPLTPGDVIAAMTAEDWRPIAPENLLIMRFGNDREVLIELAPEFAPVHVENMRRLARAGWFDGISINRVQDNYVVQWGDASGEKPLPDAITAAPPAEYAFPMTEAMMSRYADVQLGNYETHSGYVGGWPVAYSEGDNGRSGTLVHCYAMVGVGRGNNPDTGTGAELYTVIGHAPRHLDRNIALVGRIVSGIDGLSSLPRGTGPLGFYEDESERTPISTIILASELPEAERPGFKVMRTDRPAFGEYLRARANRTGWFIRPAGAVDVCNVNLPIRRTGSN